MSMIISRYSSFDINPWSLKRFSAEADSASSVDVYINNVRRATTDVPAGPFTVEQVPIINGAGNVKLVIRDLLGRETVINQPFYGSAELLRPGLYAYNYTAGAMASSMPSTAIPLSPLPTATASAAGLRVRCGLS